MERAARPCSVVYPNAPLDSSYTALAHMEDNPAATVETLDWLKGKINKHPNWAMLYTWLGEYQ